MATDLYKTWLRVDDAVRAHFALRRGHRAHAEADALKAHILHRMGWTAPQIGTHMRRRDIAELLASAPDITTRNLLERVIADL